LRERAKQEGQSMNEAAIHALILGLGISEVKARFHDLDDLAGTWQEDSDFDAAIKNQDQLDERLWK